MSRLAGKIALVTGGTTGIGLETAKEFIKNGATVIITGQNPERLATAQKELGDKATAILNDAGDPSAAPKLAAEIKSKFGHLDIAFLNAGIAHFNPIENVTVEDFDREYNVNVKGPFFQVQALLPILTSPGASVIVTASVVAHGGGPGKSLYSSTKGALVNLAQNWAAEFAPRGIRVNIISPGPINTPIFGKSGLSEAELNAFGEGIKSRIPLQRFGEPIEIAHGAVYLASDESSYMTGTEIIIGGGGHL